MSEIRTRTLINSLSICRKDGACAQCYYYRKYGLLNCRDFMMDDIQASLERLYILENHLSDEKETSEPKPATQYIMIGSEKMEKKLYDAICEYDYREHSGPLRNLSLDLVRTLAKAKCLTVNDFLKKRPNEFLKMKRIGDKKAYLLCGIQNRLSKENPSAA